MCMCVCVCVLLLLLLLFGYFAAAFPHSFNRFLTKKSRETQFIFTLFCKDTMHNWLYQRMQMMLLFASLVATNFTHTHTHTHTHTQMMLEVLDEMLIQSRMTLLSSARSIRPVLCRKPMPIASSSTRSTRNKPIPTGVVWRIYAFYLQKNKKNK